MTAGASMNAQKSKQSSALIHFVKALTEFQKAFIEIHHWY